MPTPAEDIAVLDEFYTRPLPSYWYTRLQLGYAAQAAMTDLVQHAAYNTAARRAFAESSILEKALGFGPDREYRALLDDLGQPAETSASSQVRLAYHGELKLRERMLSGIYSAATGGSWGWLPGDPSGITGWLGSEAGGRASFVTALEGDPDPTIRAALLRILRDVAVPVSWFRALAERNTLGRLDVQLREVSWPADERRVLSALSAQAAGRVSSELAKLATAPGQLPAFETGDGVAEPTAPPPARRWYCWGWTWLAAGLATVGGALAARSRR